MSPFGSSQWSFEYWFQDFHELLAYQSCVFYANSYIVSQMNLKFKKSKNTIDMHVYCLAINQYNYSEFEIADLDSCICNVLYVITLLLL